MAKKRVLTEKRYTINWYRNGFCYRTTNNCPKDYVTESRKIAKLLGEKIEVELDRVITYEF